MGRGRRAQGASRSSLRGQFGLRAEANAFADELSDLLNHTITDGIRIIAVTDQDSQQARIGYGIAPTDFEPTLIPLKVRKRPRLYLGMLFRMGPDDARRYPMIRSSVMYLTLDASGDEVLLHYDYERDKSDGYPEVHLQVCATSDAWEQASLGYGPSGRPLERLHLPVGGRRYRPTVEDLIEFLITEKLVTGRPGWQGYVQRGRAGFEERQLRAAVRRNPQAAISILREEGHIS